MRPYRYLGICASGFELSAEQLLQQMLPDAKREIISSGLIVFKYAGDTSAVAQLPFFNNVFLILREWQSNTMPFASMIDSSTARSILPSFVQSDSSGISEKRYFRIRFSRENKFCSVESRLVDQAERYVGVVTDMRPDRVNPECEFWYIVRKEPWSCFAFRLTGKQTTEPHPAKGELRPEVVLLMLGMIKFQTTDTAFLDPFAGHGAIPAQMITVARKNPDIIVYASDIDDSYISNLKRRFSKEIATGTVQVRHSDATSLTWLDSASVDVIVTDPPWGLWNKEQYNSGAKSLANLYRGMLAEFYRVLSSGGRLCLLTGAKEEFEDAMMRSSFFPQYSVTDNGITDIKNADKNATPFIRTDVLVNGRKCAVYLLEKNSSFQD